MVCFAGMYDIGDNVTKLWNDCKQGFIKDLLETNTEVQHVYDMGCRVMKKLLFYCYLCYN